MKKHILKIILTVLSTSLLLTTAGCAVLASGHSFTVQGELPAHTGITFLANYYPEDDQASACYYTAISTGDSELRKGTIGTDVPIKAVAQHYRVSIPTQKYSKFCKLQLTGVSVVVENNENNNSQTDQTGFIGVVDKTSLPATKEHPANFEINCSWFFKLGSRPSQPNSDIFRLMSCKIVKNNNVSRNIALVDLQGSNFQLNINFYKEEKPGCELCWIKTDKGWKGCINEKNPSVDGSCDNPPEFRTFKLNGKTCSVYPSCTE